MPVMSAFSTDVPAPPAPAPAAPPAPLSRYEQPFRDVVRFLTAVGQTAAPAAGADITDSFRATFGRIELPTDLEKLHGYVAQLNTIPADHLAAVLGGVSAATRTYFHKIVLELSENMKASMPELGEATAVLRLLIIRMMPALANTEESRTFGTQGALQDNYALSDRVAQLIRPDEGNPKLLSLQNVAKEAAEVGNAYAGLKGHFDSFVTRMKGLGFDTADDTRDREVIKAWESKDRTKVIILSVLLGILFIAVIVLAIVLMKRRGGSGGTGGSGRNSASTAALGGVAGGGVAGGGVAGSGVAGSGVAGGVSFDVAPTPMNFGGHHMPYPYADM